MSAAPWREKPRLRRNYTYWRCTGFGAEGFGTTPRAAYLTWRIQRDAELARRQRILWDSGPWRPFRQLSAH